MLHEAGRFWSAARRGLAADATTILLLGLGIAAPGAIFAIVDAVLLRPLPIRDPSRLEVLWRFDPRGEVPFVEVSFLDCLDWRSRTKSFGDLSCFGASNGQSVLRLNEPTPVAHSEVSATFFDVLGTMPLLGRTFRLDEQEADSHRVAVLGYRLWRDRFGGDPGVLDREILLQSYDSHSYRIIGVLPEGFEFPRGAEIWTPLRRGVPHNEDRHVGYLFLLGRLAPGVTRAEAEAEMDVLVAATDRVHSPERSRWAVAAGQGFLDFYLGSGTRRALWTLAGAVAFVLAIAWLNAGNLFLARTESEVRERAIRYALGATRRNEMGRAFAGAMLLAVIAFVLALALTGVVVNVAPRLAPYEIPSLDGTAIDAAAVTFVALLSIASAFLLTLFAVAGILSDRRGVAAPRRTRNPILVAQVAIAVVVLCGSGLAVRSFLSIAAVDPGYRAEGLLMLDVVSRDDSYPGSAKRDFHREAIARIENVPGVVSAAGVLLRPFGAGTVGWDGGFVFEGQAFEWQARERGGRTYHLPRYTDYDANPTTNVEVVTPGYFETMGIDLLEGRDFRATDTEDTPHVLIVGRSLAEKIWPGETAIGRGLMVPQSRWDENNRLQWSRIIGVVEDARYREMDGTRYDVYFADGQDEHALRNFVVRAERGDPHDLVDSIREEIRALSPGAPLARVATLEDVVWQELSPWRFHAVVFGAFAVLASFMTAVGIAGIVARAVIERRREIGIRMAVGARPQQVVGLMLARVMRPTAVGLGLGVAAALALSRVVTSRLYGVGPTDPATYAAVTALFVAVAFLAGYLPARGASRIDPVATLKRE
jgi:predicted permease